MSQVVGNSFRFQPLQRSDLIYSSSNNIYMYIWPDTKDDSINNYPFVCKWDFTCIQGKPHQIISRGAVRWMVRHVASTNQRWQKGINLQKQKKNRRHFLWQRKYYMQIWQETLKTSPCPLLVIMHLLVIVFALFVFWPWKNCVLKFVIMSSVHAIDHIWL